MMRAKRSSRAGRRAGLFLVCLLLGLLPLGCKSDSEEGGAGGGEARGGGRPGDAGRGGRPGGFGGGGDFGGGGGGDGAGVPVEVVPVERAPIALYFETNGTLEAENEVDLVARAAGPIVELNAEEGMQVREGQLLARIDDREIRTQLEVAKVRRDEARQVFERAQSLFDDQLISQEELDQAEAAFQSAQGDFERAQVQQQYTLVKAPFSGLIVERYVKFAQNLSSGERLFRLSDFTPLLCPIQVPESELPKLEKGQRARVEVAAFAGQSFEAKVLRVSPVVDAATGTVRVTLEVDGRGLLRPGMFASVFLEMESRPEALVIPRVALTLDSLDDGVFVVEGGVAERRTLRLGFRSGDQVEVLEGLEIGEPVVVVGQDGLSEGTPVVIQDREGTPAPGQEAAGGPASAGPREGRQGRGGSGPGGPPDLSNATPEQLEAIKARMRERGLSDEEIEQRLSRMRQGGGGQE